VRTRTAVDRHRPSPLATRGRSAAGVEPAYPMLPDQESNLETQGPEPC
jgi:hypothetical protein